MGLDNEKGVLKERGRGRRSLRVARGVLVAVVGTYALYLGTANVLLGASLLPALLGLDPEQMTLAYDRAYSLVPGRVELRNFRLRFQDNNIQFYIQLARGTLDLSLHRLAAREFRATRLRGEGLSYWFRHKVHDVHGIEHRVAAYPTIPGFPAIPLFAIAPPPKVLTGDEHYNLWTVQFDDIDTGVSDLWFFEFRYIGSGRVRGAFHLRPERQLWVKPTTIDLDPGALTVGPYPLAADLGLHVGATVEPLDVRVPHGLDDLHTTVARVEGEAHLVDLRSLALYLEGTGLHVRGGGGPLRFDVRLDQGRIGDGSRVEAALRDLSASSGNVVAAGNLDGAVTASVGVSAAGAKPDERFSAHGQWSGAVTAEDTPRGGMMHLRGPVAVEATTDGHGDLRTAVVRADDLHLDLRAPSGDRGTSSIRAVANLRADNGMDHPWWATFRVDGADAGVAAALLPRGNVLLDMVRPMLRNGRLEAKGQFVGGSPHAGVRFDELVVGEVKGEGSLRVHGGSVDGAFVARSGVLAVGIDIRRGELSPTVFAGDAWLAKKVGALALAPGPVR